MVKKELSRAEKIAVIESMSNLNSHINRKVINLTDKTLFLEFQKILNNTFEINLNHK